jgi:hypothetical protein
VNTDDLIRRIAEAGAPVRRLPPPWRRTLTWLAIAVPYVAVVIWLFPRTPAPGAMHGTLFILQEIAAAITAVVAAWVAFGSTVPGYEGRALRLLPLVALIVWLATVGSGCISDWVQLGSGGIRLRPDWDCLPPALLLGWLPLAVMIVMLRRGAPLRPHVSVALGALACAALCNVALRVFHLGDVTIMVLVWHVGGALIWSVAAGLIGEQVLSWRQARARALRQV